MGKISYRKLKIDIQNEIVSELEGDKEYLLQLLKDVLVVFEKFEDGENLE